MNPKPALPKTEDWLADIFEVMDGEPIEGIGMADELSLKDDVFAALEAQGEAETQNTLGSSGPSSEGAKKRARETDTTASASGPDGKMKKSQREKRRRDALNDHFMTLSGLLDPASTEALKTDKATIVTEASKVIKSLRAELRAARRQSLGPEEQQQQQRLGTTVEADLAPISG